MKTAVSPVAIALTALLGCAVCGVGAFALFAAAMSLQWWIAVAFAVPAIGVAFAVGRLLGRRSRTNGLAGAAALAAPSLLLGLVFLGDLVTFLYAGPRLDGLPVAALVFFSFAALLGIPAVVGARLAQKRGT
ncbi:MAG: hypothetical protein NTY02_10235 [Acidobacteria bacterium]|nr:hypothetical protein [Acidobacteriota bacterium]